MGLRSGRIKGHSLLKTGTRRVSYSSHKTDRDFQRLSSITLLNSTMTSNQATDASLRRFQVWPDSGSCLFDSGWSQRHASGAGMRYPDWPTCFGQWVPTHESQFATINKPTLNLATPIPGLTRKWTEYLNRLLGVSIGVLIFSALLSLPLRHLNASIAKASVAAFSWLAFRAGWVPGW